MARSIVQSAAHAEGSALTGRAGLESRIAQHDGYLWPFDRPRMVMPGPIRERMVEDIGRLVRDGGEDAVVTLADLSALGWPQAQVEAHGIAAFAAYKAATGACQPRRPDRAIGARMVAEAAALLLFCGAALLWAGLGTGAI